MNRGKDKLRQDAIEIWEAGLDAVKSDRLVSESIRISSNELQIGSEKLERDSFDRIIVVGGGKAGAGMVAGFESALAPLVREGVELTGWVNVPAGCVRANKQIHLHAARPDGLNEPTTEGVAGTRKILELAANATERDLLVCLISGGGSALLPAPNDGITLDDKLEVTRFLSAAGANIEQLNTVRKQLSCIKGGGLARACNAKLLVSLIISDVMGDPLDVIASGPTVADTSTPQDALEILDQFQARGSIADRVFETLSNKQPEASTLRNVSNHIIGNNLTAVESAAAKARELGYQVQLESAAASEGVADEIGSRLAETAKQMRRGETEFNCLVSGGEPVVQLADSKSRGKGGRNQQLVLAALEHLAEELNGICMLSGGTDGEDGPTDAAGAIVDESLAGRFDIAEIQDHLVRNDAYHFFDRADHLGQSALLKTGPTDTNVCDLRIVVVDSEAADV